MGEVKEAIDILKGPDGPGVGRRGTRSCPLGRRGSPRRFGGCG